MMKNFLMLIVVFFLAFCSGCSREIPTNEQPMYGNIPRTAYEQKVDEQFINTVVKQFGSRKTAAKKHIEFAWHYYHNGDSRTAMKRFNQAWLLDPNNAEVYFGFGLLMSEQKRPDEAIDLYTKAIQLNPNYAKAYHNRALDYCRKGDFNQGISDFSKAIKNEPNNGQAYNDRAVAYFEIRENEKSWNGVNMAEEVGYKPHQGFLAALKKA
ncbi:MAG: tetratricopeptide repeat protein, partial [Candidatus Omnitrophota bacterium]